MDEMKTFFVFAMNGYYPLGGMKDFINSFHTIEEAEEYVNFNRLREKYDYVDIVDISENL